MTSSLLKSPDTTLLDRKDQLVAYMESGCKPRTDWRIGTEHEKFAFDLETLRPLAYEGEKGIAAVLEGFRRFGWQPVVEDGKTIALMRDGGSVTLEPGGQIELSGAPLASLHETCREVHTHLGEAKEIGEELGIAMMGIGFLPKWKRQDMPWMPKARYGIMRRYMPTRGDHGLDMMLRTCTVQVNLDFESEPCMVRKFRIGLALQPVATALFANSPFTEGQPNGYLSYRSQVWTDTDPDRCGVLPFVFEDGFGFERYVDYMLDVPMYFVRRDGRYIDVAGQSFHDFLAGKLPALPGQQPQLSDWEDHLTTVFPEVRLKHFLEMRGADGGPWARLCAFSALWVGLLYGPVAMDAAWDLVKDWTAEDHARLRAEVPRDGLATQIGNRTLRALAGEVLEIARTGLASRAVIDTKGRDETQYLEPLLETVASGCTPAEEWLDAFTNRWDGCIEPLFTENAY
ncbi:MAG: glutamate--cysteine ligase [Alphaproteobacteria bacterium]|nr:glutamate--cysteine ligase [Alphaproteobacteria bacterium]MDP6660638.1 glutamate--cysteine ligase [Alphaproteobacteria bacterium]MDP6781457.1 glutamate--cysteine ligase [Alphaproteobacteria bacterium]MDP7044494.1 glutamate--cysteine ligase [Alphaproteobacteria bacterium]